MEKWKHPSVLGAVLVLVALGSAAAVTTVPWWLFVAWVVLAALAGLQAHESEPRTPATRTGTPVHSR